MGLTPDDVQFVALTFGAMVAARILLGFLCFLGGWNTLSSQITGSRRHRVALLVLNTASLLWLPVAFFLAQQLHWFDICFWLSIAGILEMFAWMWVMFASATSGQRRAGDAIYASGPYAVVRHPMYTATVITMVAAALLTGGTLVLLMAAVLSVLYVAITAFEDRLMQQLAAYQEYSRQTRHQLIPWIW